MQNYFLYTSDNKVQPANFVGNKVSGVVSIRAYPSKKRSLTFSSFSRIR
jgi:hypothetical protein